MIPSFEQRDELLKGFAKALFRRDLDALYAVVTPDFLWSFHDGVVGDEVAGRPRANPRASRGAAGAVLGAAFRGRGLSSLSPT